MLDSTAASSQPHWAEIAVAIVVDTEVISVQSGEGDEHAASKERPKTIAMSDFMNYSRVKIRFRLWPFRMAVALTDKTLTY